MIEVCNQTASLWFSSRDFYFEVFRCALTQRVAARASGGDRDAITAASPAVDSVSSAPCRSAHPVPLLTGSPLMLWPRSSASVRLWSEERSGGALAASGGERWGGVGRGGGDQSVCMLVRLSVRLSPLLSVGPKPKTNLWGPQGFLSQPLPRARSIKCDDDVIHMNRLTSPRTRQVTWCETLDYIYKYIYNIICTRV